MPSLPPDQVPAPPEGNVDKGPLINIFDAWIVALDVIVIILRFVTRIFITEPKIWWDDWFIFVALICILIGASGNGAEVHYGFGRPEHYLTAYQVRYYIAWTYGEWIQTMLTLMCTKVSICFFLLRVPATASRKLSLPLWIGIGILLVSNIILTLLWILQCKPVKAVWDLQIEGKCFSHNMILQMILAQALISIISDFVLSLFPILILHKLNMRMKQKIGLAILMGLGLITGACSIVRTVLNGKALAGDATYGGITNWFWRLFEVDLGLICACIPTLVPMWKWATKKVQQSYYLSRMKSYIPRASISKGRPSFSRPSVGKGTSGKASKGSLGVPGSDRNGWQEKNVKQPKRAMLASRTERAIMGRAGSGFDDMTTLKTEAPPEDEPGTNTTAEGTSAHNGPQTEEERQHAAQEWETSLRMPWMDRSREPRMRDFASDIEIARNTSLTVTLEDTKRNRGLNTSSSRDPLVSDSSMDNTDHGIEMQRMGRISEDDQERRNGGFWNRVVTAVSGGERNSGAWKKMHSPKPSEG